MVPPSVWVLALNHPKPRVKCQERRGRCSRSIRWETTKNQQILGGFPWFSVGIYPIRWLGIVFLHDFTWYVCLGELIHVNVWISSEKRHHTTVDLPATLLISGSCWPWNLDLHLASWKSILANRSHRFYLCNLMHSYATGLARTVLGLVYTPHEHPWSIVLLTISPYVCWFNFHFWWV